MNGARKRPRRLSMLFSWLGLGLVFMLLILITLQPGLVLGLVRPSAAYGTAAAPAALPEAGRAGASQTVRPAPSGSGPATAASGANPATPSTPEPSAPAAAAPATVPPSAAPSGTPAGGASATEPDGLPGPGTDAEPADGIFGDGGPSGLSPLAECCGGQPGAPPLTQQKNIELARIVNGKQKATVTVDSYGYSPQILVVQKGIETTLDFDLKQPDSCSDQIWFSLLDRTFNLAAGEKVPAFKPAEDFSFSCWMGMRSVYVKVVKDLAKADVKQIEREVIDALNEASVDCH